MQNLETDAEAYAQDISPQCNRIEAYHKRTLMKLLINGENARVRENEIILNRNICYIMAIFSKPSSHISNHFHSHQHCKPIAENTLGLCVSLL